VPADNSLPTLSGIQHRWGSLGNESIAITEFFKSFSAGKYHNCPLSIVNCPFNKLLDKPEFDVELGGFLTIIFLCSIIFKEIKCKERFLWYIV